LIYITSLESSGSGPLIAFDHDTMPRFLRGHLEAGGHPPGMFVVRPRSRVRDILAWLVEAADSGDDDQWRDQVVFVP